MENTEKRKIVESTIKILRKKGLLKEFEEQISAKEVVTFLKSLAGEGFKIVQDKLQNNRRKIKMIDLYNQYDLSELENKINSRLKNISNIIKITFVTETYTSSTGKRETPVVRIYMKDVA